MQIDRKKHYVYALDDGVHEPLVELGATVTEEQDAARIHFPADPRRDPILVRFPADGEVVCGRAIDWCAAATACSKWRR